MYLTYLRRELRRRIKQAIVVALGLGVGIGLVMTVSATSAGVKTAQAQVLHSLYGVGTDVTVTKTAAAGTGGPQRFGGFGGGAGGGSGPRPAAGTHISRNTLRVAPGAATLPSADVSKVAAMKDVSAATGGLVLADTSFSGTIPSFSAGSGGGPAAGGGAGANFNINSFSVDGLSISAKGIGPLTASQVTSGNFFNTSQTDANVAVVSSSYATQHQLKVGSTVKVAGKSLSVIGLTSVSSSDVFVPLATAQRLSGLTGKVSTIYASATSASNVEPVAAAVRGAVPGSTITTSTSLANEVTGSLTSASSLATNLGRWLSVVALIVAFLIGGLLMMAAVSRRVREFGTLKAIGWRTRRIVGQVMGEGVTLGLAGGVIGLVLGVAGSEIVSAVSPSLSASVGSAAPAGPVGPTGGGRGFGGGGGLGPRGANAVHTVLVHLTAPLQVGAVGFAIVLAIAGGVIAGTFGSWRAARLRPAAALRRVE